MTPTDELRRLLDERGVKYDKAATVIGETVATFWHDHDGYPCSAIEGADDIPDGEVSLQAPMTPAQAIAATLGAGTIDKAAERIEVLSGFAREYLHRYGYLMSAAGEDVTDEVWAIEQVISEVCGAKVVDLREKS